jgi:hypothetical protein
MLNSGHARVVKGVFYSADKQYNGSVTPDSGEALNGERDVPDDEHGNTAEPQRCGCME